MSIAEETHNFFCKLFSSKGVNVKKMNNVLEKLDKKISNEDREWCEAPITLAEVEAAIKSLNKNKSPGIEGLTTIASIISISQAYSIPDRDISYSILTIKDTVRKMEKQGGLLLSLDLEKSLR